VADRPPVEMVVQPAELQVGDVLAHRTVSSVIRNGWGYDVNFLGYSEAGPEWFDYADAVTIHRPMSATERRANR
jgi:hypothetical protein